MSDWAAKVLAGVPTTSIRRSGSDEDSITVIALNDAIAAIARMGAGDGLVEAGRSADTMRKMAEVLPMGSAIRIAAFAAADTITDLLAHIAALTAQVAEKEEQLVSVLRREAATHERHDAKMAELTDPIAVHANMLRGTIAKPTVEQIIHLYGVDALCKALVPVIVQEADVNKTPKCERDLGNVLTEAADRIAALTAQNQTWQRNSRETFDAMVAMRNSINEHLPMPSLESDLLQGPENSVFCAAVAEAVVSAVHRLRAKVARLQWELINLPTVYAHQINTGVREVYDPLQRFYAMESVLDAITEAGK